MAELWREERNGTLYEVRQAGRSVRLYTNGIFHSQWNPARPLAGHLWDLLSLPAFFGAAPNSVMMLGVGGGAAINALNYLFAPQHITGVDLDSTHLRIARKHFKCDADNTTLVCRDAREVLQDTPKASVDFLVEDLFSGDGSGEARRAIIADRSWMRRLSHVLTRRGMLVMNFEHERQCRDCIAELPKNRYGFSSIYSLRTPRYDNAVGVFIRDDTSLNRFEQRVRQFPHPDQPRLMNGILRNWRSLIIKRY